MCAAASNHHDDDHNGSDGAAGEEHSPGAETSGVVAHTIDDVVDQALGPRYGHGRQRRREFTGDTLPGVSKRLTRVASSFDGGFVVGEHDDLLGRGGLVRGGFPPGAHRNTDRLPTVGSGHAGCVHGETLGPTESVRPVDRREEADRWQRRLESLLGTPATTGNEIRVLRNGGEIFPTMLRAIDQAERTVDLVTFVYWQGDVARRFADALASAARRGCRVRVLLDAVGARKLDASLVDHMSDAGCDVRWFRPIADSVPKIGDMDHRTHRKILVCDAEVGFTGGVGIADEWDGDARDPSEWRDTHLQIRGRAVAGLQAGFIDNWADQNDDGLDPHAEPIVDATSDSARGPGSSTCSVIRGSAETGASEIWRLMLSLITCATRRVRVATAYFNPDERLCAAMAEAVERGVEVSILLPGEHADKRFVQLAGESVYASLIDAGVDIRTYDVSMMHAKVITVDGALATVGSANMNQRSTQYDEETNVVIFDPDVVAVLDRHLDADHQHSTKLDPSDWAERGMFRRAGEKVADIVSGWL